MIITPASILKKRTALGLNQADFWNKLGITQSGGSRYENGRNIPPSTQKLYFLVYGADVLAALPGKDARTFLAVGK